MFPFDIKIKLLLGHFSTISQIIIKYLFNQLSLKKAYKQTLEVHTYLLI